MPMPKTVNNNDISDSEEFKVTKTLESNRDLEGVWYKVAGISEVYDMFDCQSNTLKVTDVEELKNAELGITFRTKGSKGGYYKTDLMENVEFTGKGKLRTTGSMYGLTFNERWTIVAGGDLEGGRGKFWVVRYVGKTLQGEYEGGFVYSSLDKLTEGDRGRVREAWMGSTGVDDYAVKFKDIDNTCSTNVGGKGELRRDKGEEGVGGWGEVKDLIFGEGGIGDWIKPGWRGEYDDK
ncbi:hypothetical protein TrCOL_g12659 [Triparma columacea]|uniref:VDE lipocalin domain-containing protein n=1 Tax=Triparma columacea TaxID=722753 RepID=A0A9W7GI12_9STRA|nr:hypothetical protein TrCOL_g12659 [Triparma columacea]